MNFKKQIEQAFIHQQAGRFDEAEAIYRAVLQRDGNQPDALFLYGALACATSRATMAVPLLQEAISLRPNQADYHFNLGYAYRELGELELAYPQFQRAVYLAPGDISNQVTLASLLDDMRQYKSAIRQFDKMVERWPKEGVVYYYYGLTLKRCGRLDEAMAMFRKALEVGDQPARGTQAIASLKKFASAADPDLKAMEAALDAVGVSDAHRSGLCFALAKAYDNFDDVEHSFEYLARGNAIKRQGYEYVVEEDTVMFDRIKATFNTALFEQHKAGGSQDTTPVFVVGMPRSGTSLVEQILSSHSEVIGAGELNDLRQVYLTTHTALNRNNYPEGVMALSDIDLTVMGDAYIKRLRQHSKTAHFIVDKMPHNFLAIGLIALMLPNARIIHCNRSPMDTCFSIFKQNFSGVLTHKYAYEMVDLAGYYRIYADMMDHWRKVLPGRVLDISYEALVDDQERETRRMIDYLSLPWEDDCLSFQDNTRAVHTASVTQVRKPMYRHAVMAWKRFETQLAPLKAVLGGLADESVADTSVVSE